ncbi:fatty acyl-CoA reductase 1 [Trichonephila clavipes]|nr:fatty acyl-CoA reductase 1 [Trichonephila clavipes]
MRKLNPTPCDVPIINCVCPDNYQLSWNEVTKICMPLLLKYPSERLFSPPGGIVTSNEILHGLCKLFLHYLPASTIDALTLLTLGRAKMVNTYKRIHGVMNHLQLYTTRRFFFTSKNLSTMIASQLPEDAETFPIDQSKFKWSEYLENYVHGVRLYFLKEDDDTLPSARKRLFRSLDSTRRFVAAPSSLPVVAPRRRLCRPPRNRPISLVYSLSSKRLVS